MGSESPKLAPEVLNRLLIGRELLRSFGPNLTPQSDPLAVSRAILVAQDAAELISSAIAEHLSAERKERMGLPEYLDSIEKRSSTAFPGKSFFSALNRTRVSFKHHGVLPNVTEFHSVLSRAEDHLDLACKIFLRVSLSDLDLSLLIADIQTRTVYNEALDFSRNGKCREALETLARAMEGATRTMPMYIGAGHPESEVALQLTAYGVDPGAFIRMQHFLPKLGIGDEINWDTRGYGHPGNWRRRNVEFCLETFLDLVLKLQYAEHLPYAAEFSFLYDDVVTAKSDGIVIHSQWYSPFFGRTSHEWERFGILKAGERIVGHLIPAFQIDNGKWEKTSFDVADIYVMEHALIERGSVPSSTVLIVKVEDVNWSYVERRGMRDYAPHFFEPRDEENGSAEDAPRQPGDSLTAAPEEATEVDPSP